MICLHAYTHIRSWYIVSSKGWTFTGLQLEEEEKRLILSQVYVLNTFEVAVATTGFTTFLNAVPSGPASERFAGTRQRMDLSPKLCLVVQQNGANNHTK